MNIKQDWELGQLMWGAPNTKKYNTPEWVAEELYGLAECILGEEDMSCYGLEIDNKIFEMHRYWWGDENAPAAKRPNFRHKNSGIEISWYKYIGRGMSANIDLDEMGRDKFRDLIDECRKSAECPVCTVL